MEDKTGRHTLGFAAAATGKPITPVSEIRTKLADEIRDELKRALREKFGENNAGPKGCDWSAQEMFGFSIEDISIEAKVDVEYSRVCVSGRVGSTSQETTLRAQAVVENAALKVVKRMFR